MIKRVKSHENRLETKYLLIKHSLKQSDKTISLHNDH